MKKAWSTSFSRGGRRAGWDQFAAVAVSVCDSTAGKQRKTKVQTNCLSGSCEFRLSWMLVESWHLGLCHSIPFLLLYGKPQGWTLEVVCRDLPLASPSERSVSTGRVGSIALACVFLALKVRLVPASFEDPEFNSSFNQSFSLYTKYQVAIHQEAPEICEKSEVLSLKHFFPILTRLSRSMIYLNY